MFPASWMQEQAAMRDAFVPNRNASGFDQRDALGRVLAKVYNG